MRDLLASLSDHPMAMLRGIAELRSVALASNARDAAAAQLAASLAEPEVTEAALATCSPEAQAAWAALRAAGGRLKAPAFARFHGSIRPIGPGKLERDLTWQHPESPAEELWYRGLIFRAFADFGSGPAEYLYIPEDLLSSTHMDQDQPKVDNPFSASPITIVAAPARAQQTENALVVDMCTLLAAIREAPIQVDRTGHWRQTDASRLQEGLLQSDATRFDLLMTLAQESRWLLVDQGRLTVQIQALTGWLQETPWEQMTSLFAAWHNSSHRGSATGTSWNDLRHVPTLQAEGTWDNDSLAARRVVLDALRQLDPTGWYALADLTAWIKAVDPDFQRPDGNYGDWYLRDVTTEHYLSGFESWDAVEGRLIRFLITGPLFWLGAVALEAGDHQASAVFRLTPTGVAWLTQTIPSRFPAPARLAVDEDFTITAPLLLPLLDRSRLLRFSEPSDSPWEWGQPTRHRITRGSLARARRAGVKPEAIIQFLRRATGGNVPPRVVAGLSRWNQRGSTVRISKGAVLRVEDANVLAILRADPVIIPLLGDLLSAQAVLVSEANLPRLMAALVELGYTAKYD